MRLIDKLASWLRRRLAPTGDADSPAGRVFISYTQKDEQAVSILVRDLQTGGVSVWFAPLELLGGDQLNPVIRRAIDNARFVLVALSGPASNSPWVAREVEYGARAHASRYGREGRSPLSGE